MSNSMRLYRDRFNSYGVMAGQDEPIKWGRALAVITLIIMALYGLRLLQNYVALKDLCQKSQPAATTCQVTMHEVLAI